jgi:hypothetical protein
LFAVLADDERRWRRAKQLLGIEREPRWIERGLHVERVQRRI